ncbi:MAG: YbaN family protein [Gammaproteobacteria bacterium]
MMKTIEHSSVEGTRPQLRYAGHALMGLGVVGMFLPVVPTTIFWILAAYCYAKSSPEHYRRLLAHSRYGRVVEDFVERGVISRRGKQAALIGMSVGALIVIVLQPGSIVLILALGIILAAAIYVVSRPEFRA